MYRSSLPRQPHGAIATMELIKSLSFIFIIIYYVSLVLFIDSLRASRAKQTNK